MANFSVEQAKAALTGDVGHAYYLSRTIDRARDEGSLAYGASAYVNCAVKCFLVGFYHPGQQLLDKAEQWLELAVETEEKPRIYFPAATEAMRLSDLALCRWLSRGTHESELLRESISLRERYFQQSRKVDRVELTLVIPDYVDARRLDAAWQRAEKLWKTGKFPLELELAREMIEIGIDDSAVRKRIESFFALNVPRWFEKGLFSMAARWIKITTSQPSGSLPAQEVILRTLNFV